MLTKKQFKALAGMLKHLAETVDKKVLDKETADFLKVELISQITSFGWQNDLRFDQEKFLIESGQNDFYCEQVRAYLAGKAGQNEQGK